MKNMKNTIRIYFMALWFTIALIMISSGHGEFTIVNAIGVALFAAFALFTNIADKKGWIKLNEDNEA